MFEEAIKKHLDKVVSFFLFLPILNRANESFKFDNVYQLEKRKLVCVYSSRSII